VRLRLTDPSFGPRLASFLRSVGVEVDHDGEGVLEVAAVVDGGELAIYLRVWSVLHPEAPVQLEE
jgi:hypothetical protein